MDPEEALKQLREKMQRMQQIVDENTDNDLGRIENEAALDELEDVANEAVDLWNGLDRWMSMGGFLPKDWAKDR